jgi:glycosyltransferase involved in cell wall biosynthesis
MAAASSSSNVEPTLSVVVPAFNAAGTIGETLASIFSSDHPVEVIVVDDGSADPAALAAAVRRWPAVRLIRHEVNRGMCAARNTGIAASRGALVAILDADDRLVHDWRIALDATLAAWPADLTVCLAGCATPDGRPTARRPDYTGPMTTADFVNGRYPGEYLLMFRGDYIRSHGFVDLGMRKSCGTLTYLTLLRDAPFWISARVLRIYHDVRAGSVTSGWWEPAKARESALCSAAIIERFGPLYAQHAPSAWCGLHLRLALYRRLAGDRDAWAAFRRGAHWRSAIETLGTLGVLLTGPRGAVFGVALGRRLGLLRRYG